MVFDLAHLERRAVAVAHEVADEAGILADLAGAAAVADAGGLDDGGVVAHVVDDADEAVIEDGGGFEEEFFEGGDGGAPGFGGVRTVGLDFGNLVLGQRHGGP